MLETELLYKKKAVVSDTVFLTHFDGVIEDVYGHGVVVYGGAGLSTERVKFGAGSFLSTYNTSFGIGGLTPLADFTFDFWGFRTGPGSNYGVMAYTGGSPNIQLIIDYAANGTIGCYWESGGGIQTSEAGLIVPNQWNHFAWVRKGSILMCFINGLKKLTASVSSAGFLPIWLNGYSTSAVGGFNGYVDEMSISNTARWTEDFIPSSTAYQ